MRDRIPPFLLHAPAPPPQDAGRGGKVHQAAIDKGIRKFSSLIVSMSRDDEISTRKGLFQALDARVKLVFLVFFVVIVSLKQTILQEAVIAFLLFALTVSSRIPLGPFYARTLVCTFFFGFLIAFPAAFNVVTPGKMLWPVLMLEQSHDFLIYHIPREIGFTSQGLETLVMLCLRVLNSLSISFLVLGTTQPTQIIKALQVFRIPAAFILIVTLSVKYIVVFSRNVEDMYLARKSRSLTAERGRAARAWVAGRIAYIFKKSERRYEEIYRVMAARGYTHEYRQPAFERIAIVDRFALGVFLLVGVSLLIW